MSANEHLNNNSAAKVLQLWISEDYCISEKMITFSFKWWKKKYCMFLSWMEMLSMAASTTQSESCFFVLNYYGLFQTSTASPTRQALGNQHTKLNSQALLRKNYAYFPFSNGFSSQCLAPRWLELWKILQLLSYTPLVNKLIKIISEPSVTQVWVGVGVNEVWPTPSSSVVLCSSLSLWRDKAQ